MIRYAWTPRLPAGFIRYRLIPVRNLRFFTPIIVTNPTGIRWLKRSRSVLKGIGMSYFILAALGVTAYFGLKSESDSEQPLPKDWPVKVKVLVRSGVHQALQRKYPLSARHFQDALKELDPIYEANESLDDKWLASYADINIRLGLMEFRSRNHEAAKLYLEKGYHMDQGLRYLKAQAGVQLAAYSEDDPHQAERYLRTAIADSAISSEMPALEATVLHNDGPVEVPSSVELTEDQIPALLELGKLYARTGRLEDAFITLLSTYRGIIESNDPLKKPRGQEICASAVLAAHISEILWALKNKREAVSWAEESFRQSKNLSHSTVECGTCAKLASGLTFKMYQAMGMEADAQRFKKIHDTQYVPKINLTKGEATSSIFRK